MSDNNEFERSPVQPERLEPARHFAANYSGEHVAGTEFVIGAAFVAWGVSTQDILWGLLWGNLLAVLTWGLICAPIAVNTRLTLYAYLERIGGKGIINLYSVVNGILFCVLAGAMITVSASAARILFNIPVQVNWYPTSISFVFVALAVGAMVTMIAVKGFRRVAIFAQVCAPWMILMFIVGALTLYAVLSASTSELAGQGAWARFMTIAETHIWQGSDSGLNAWHVAAFAWVANLAMHGGLSDMTLLRYARKSSYGFLSALGMFIGHYMAWVCAGIMGAGAAYMLKTSIVELDAGAVAFQALGATGIIVVIIAGWTTSNPTIYRAGLAFHSLRPCWNRTVVTAITGAVTTVIACFPFVFTQLLDFVGLMGLILAPVGAVIVAEHWLFPRLGLTRYWNHYRGGYLNWPALLAWVLSLAAAWGFSQWGLHLFFLLLPVWVTATLLYIGMASLAGGREAYREQAEALEHAEDERREQEQRYLEVAAHQRANQAIVSVPKGQVVAGLVALLSLLVCLGLGIGALRTGDITLVHNWLLLPSIAYMVSATLWSVMKERQPKSAV
ncbi:purine-cytosine permease family protein [Marinimicrobium alkaliphilum]|uniref:purine-cytosine permease family protein n=1 Tax=Marinimicrobium alkaliphilum TaxID=2202654 RepID=UPI000DB90AF2|nr:nucleoside transporter [Marinimicrobium alkaliphilum]